MKIPPPSASSRMMMRSRMSMQAPIVPLTGAEPYTAKSSGVGGSPPPSHRRQTGRLKLAFILTVDLRARTATPSCRLGAPCSLIERQIDEGDDDRQPEQDQEGDEEGDPESQVAALELLVHHRSASIAIATKSKAR